MKSKIEISTSTTKDRLWANRINKEIYISIPKIERKRQENLFELIYTEEDYVESLNYLESVNSLLKIKSFTDPFRCG